MAPPVLSIRDFTRVTGPAYSTNVERHSEQSHPLTVTKDAILERSLKTVSPLANPLATDKLLPFFRGFNFQADCSFYGEGFTHVRELLGMQGPWRSLQAVFLKCPSWVSSWCWVISGIPLCHQLLCIHLLSVSIYFCSGYHAPKHNCVTWTSPNVCNCCCFLQVYHSFYNQNLLKT